MSFSTQPRGTFFALALIVAGAILFLDNIGILPAANIGAYWPMAFVVYGIGMAVRRMSIVWALTTITFGVVLTLSNIGLLHADFSVIWPLLLIAFGASAIVHRTWWNSRWNSRWNDRWNGDRLRERLQGRWNREGFPGPDAAAGGSWANKWTDKRQWREWRREQRRRGWHDFVQKGYAESSYRGSWLHEVAIFFSAERHMEGRDVSGGELVAVFGSVEIDLRGATVPFNSPTDGSVPVRRAELEATAVFGSVEIRVPQTWRVVKNGAGVFGAYEDKTLPVRPEPGVEPPTLFVHGGAVFGSVTIESC